MPQVNNAALLSRTASLLNCCHKEISQESSEISPQESNWLIETALGEIKDTIAKTGSKEKIQAKVLGLSTLLKTAQGDVHFAFSGNKLANAISIRFPALVQKSLQVKASEGCKALGTLVSRQSQRPRNDNACRR